MSKTSHPSFLGTSRDSAIYRARQADIDADIEGLAKDLEISALTDQMIADGVSVENYKRRLLDAIKNRKSESLAAE